MLSPKNYKKPETKLWQGRRDSLENEHFFQLIKCIDPTTTPFDSQPNAPAIIGFSVDEGIRRNEGRVGASLGPNKLREHLGHLASENQHNIFDFGNITCDDKNLESSQDSLANLVDFCHEKELKTIVFGGGHEASWGHFQGLTKHYRKIGIINFDAHFDMREPKDNQSTSGTPFYQIKQYCDDQNQAFNYCCLGIQRSSNTKSMFERAESFNVPFLTTEQIQQESFAWQTAFLDNFIMENQVIYLSICLDVFAECYAPGVSAPQACGLTPTQVLPLLKYINQTGKVVAIDIVELSPKLDEADKTSRLGAKIIADLI